MRLFDTMSGEVRELVAGDGRRFRFYCCGPTVYGPAHIGNFRTFVLQDVLRRVLEVGGVETFHVRNVTDVDDKTIRDSQAAGVPLGEFTAGWEARFHEDCEALNLLRPHVEPRATEHIGQQVEMIQALVDGGFAYASSDGSVYFRLASFPGYGRLSRLDGREIQAGAAGVDSDEYEKDGVGDFVLWKGHKPEDGENFWSSPWGDGRPGWHLECSAMIQEYLGEDFDLHGGGVDLTFPHHENEIAQSVCACGGGFAGHWFHTTHLKVDGQKMSKSLGNLYTLGQLMDEGVSPMEVRFELLGGYYRKPLNFTFGSLHAKREALGKLAEGELAVRRAAGIDAGAPAPSYEELCGLGQDGGFGVFEPAWQLLNQDLNTAGAVGKLFSGLKYAGKQGDPEQNWRGFHGVLAALGLILPEVVQVPEVEVPAEIQELADRRWEAKLRRDWASADALRDELAGAGWLVKDGKEGYELWPSG